MASLLLPPLPQPLQLNLFSFSTPRICRNSLHLAPVLNPYSSATKKGPFFRRLILTFALTESDSPKSIDPNPQPLLQELAVIFNSHYRILVVIMFFVQFLASCPLILFPSFLLYIKKMNNNFMAGQFRSSAGLPRAASSWSSVGCMSKPRDLFTFGEFFCFDFYIFVIRKVLLNVMWGLWSWMMRRLIFRMDPL